MILGKKNKTTFKTILETYNVLFTFTLQDLVK